MVGNVDIFVVVCKEYYWAAKYQYDKSIEQSI